MSPYWVIATGFAVVFATTLVVELLGRAGIAPFRPLGDVLHAAMAGRSGRVLVLAVWLWLGFHFLAR